MKKALALFILSTILISLPVESRTYHLLIGTYTNPAKSQGIYSYDINVNKAVFTEKSVTTGISNPSFLALTSDKKFVYSVSESPKESAAWAFSFDSKKGMLNYLNRSLTKSSGPCNILATEKHVFTANYGGGSISVFERKTDGSLTDLVQLIQHTGNSINKERQKEPHVHQIIVSPDKKFLLANDLGTDKVTVYQYNPDAQTEILTAFDTLTVKLGSGPRHATFSKDGKILYLVQEIDGTVSVIGFNNEKLKLIQETTIDNKTGIQNRAADIHLSPDGKYLYVTNRKPANDISCFKVAKNGKLTLKQQISTEGDGPRNFAITPDGKFLFVAHQYSDKIVIFKRDISTGLLVDSSKRIEVGSPVCLLFY